MLLPLYLFSIWIEKRILDTLQENQVLPDNCPILHPEETQESVILKERFFFGSISKKCLHYEYSRREKLFGFVKTSALGHSDLD